LGAAGKLAGLALALALSTGAAAAQDAAPVREAVPGSPFLFISQERLLTGSRAGQALLAEEEKSRDTLRAEARALDSAFEAEERDLTEKRATMEAGTFRALADAFDARVVQARKDQDERASALAQEFDQRRRQFYGRIAPLLVQIMDRAGARAVFDENSALLTDQTLNITDEVIAAIDAGETGPATPENAAPEQPAGPAPAPALAPALEGSAPEEAPPAVPPTEETRPVARPEGGN
jgi:Skp family chaperone for outer membrane proteins